MMKVSLNWIKDFIQVNQSTDSISSLLTDTGLEVEGVEKTQQIKGGLAGLVVGEVKTCVKHENADKLKVTTVDIGQEIVQIVCGAPNVSEGQKVIVAPVGTTIFPISGDPFKIKKAKIRGVLSQGMICAEDEIGLGAQHDGIITLDSNLLNGTLAADHFDVGEDVVFEIGLTPNRGDATSHLGVARDIKAITGDEISISGLENISNRLPKPTNQVIIDDSEGCPRYSSVELSGIKVGPSPDWLRQRLITIGLSPINNVVDVTNYVMHDLGQPLHAFDANEIGGNEIRVRRAKKNEKLVTLDGKKRTLDQDDLLICDHDSPVAIAGVFGGENSGITENTTTVFIESAYFDPTSVRKTAKKQDLQTDASYRYERGCDPNMTITALQRAAFLLKEVAGGELSSCISDVYPNKIEPLKISLSLAKLNRFIGHEFTAEEVVRILNSLDIVTEAQDEGEWLCTVPPFRSEVTRDVDLYEEVLRIFGYNNIAFSTTVVVGNNNVESHKKVAVRKKIKQSLKGLGFHEISTNSLTSESNYSEEELNEAVRMLNPLSAEMAVLRMSMTHDLAKTCLYNINRKNKDLKLFEFGREYKKTENGYQEKEVLMIGGSGAVFNQNWTSPKQQIDHFYMKGIVDALAKGVGFDASKINAEYMYVNDVIPDLEEEAPIIGVKIQLDRIVKTIKKSFKLEAIPVFPVVKRDLSVVLNEDVQFEQLENIAQKTGKSKLINIGVSDVYKGKPLNNDQKSYVISLYLYNPNQTMSDKEIDGIMEKLIRNYTQELNAIIRR